MTHVTLVMAYYENPAMLGRQFANLRALPDELKRLLKVIIVDDASPRFPARPENLDGVDLTIYRMRKDIPWNQDACRNIGMKNVTTKWVLMTDMDHLVPEHTWRYVLLNEWNPEKVYRFQRFEMAIVECNITNLIPAKTHLNSYLMTKDMFYRIGGYDERFAGMYQDHDFHHRVAPIANIETITEPIICVTSAVIADANTTAYNRVVDKPRIKQIKKERGTNPPLRYRFAYDRVY